MSAFQIGDVVELKSGSPRMTVESEGQDGGGRPYTFCAWFSGDEKKTAQFAPNSLKKSKAEWQC